MVPSGELHITAVDYRHTHHPYFCIVKHLNTGASQESLPFHLTLRGETTGTARETARSVSPFSVARHDVLLQARADERPGVLHQCGAGPGGGSALPGAGRAPAQPQLVPREQQPAAARQLRAQAPLPGSHAAHRGRPGQ